jgi:hypothetical protein
LGLPFYLAASGMESFTILTVPLPATDTLNYQYLEMVLNLFLNVRRKGELTIAYNLRSPIFQKIVIYLSVPKRIK